MAQVFLAYEEEDRGVFHFRSISFGWPIIRPADAARAGPFPAFYAALMAKGMKPKMARLTLARGMAAITLLARNKKVHFKHATPIHSGPAHLRLVAGDSM